MGEETEKTYRVVNRNIAGGRVQLQPYNIVVAFDSEGISEPVDEATAREATLVPGYSVLEPEQPVIAQEPALGQVGQEGVIPQSVDLIPSVPPPAEVTAEAGVLPDGGDTSVSDGGNSSEEPAPAESSEPEKAEPDKEEESKVEEGQEPPVTPSPEGDPEAPNVEESKPEESKEEKQVTLSLEEPATPTSAKGKKNARME